MNITFDDNLITGNKTIDSQHQELIDRIRQFVAACESGDSKIKAIKMLDYLDEYTNFHFQEEEELQKKVSYPEFSGHHAKHEEFKTSIQELYDYLNGERSRFALAGNQIVCLDLGDEGIKTRHIGEQVEVLFQNFLQPHQCHQTRLDQFPILRALLHGFMGDFARQNHIHRFARTVPGQCKVLQVMKAR